MAYQAEIRFHGHDEMVYEETFNTIQGAVDFIEKWAAGRSDGSRVWINNVRVWLKGCRVVDRNGEAICTNPKWHEIFARPDEQITPRKDIASVVADALKTGGLSAAVIRTAH